MVTAIRSAAALLLCLAAACAPRQQLTTASTAPASLLGSGDNTQYMSSDGRAAPVRIWSPAQPPRAVIVAVHGFNDYRNAFDRPATWWAGRGVQTYAYDQRGFGATSEVGIWPGTEALVADLCAFLVLVAARHPDIPLHVAGHSMGGAVVLASRGGAGCRERVVVSGVILIAPAVWGRASLGPIARAALWLGAHVVPALHVNGNGLDITPSDNEEMLRELSADPLVIKNTRIDAVYGMVNLMDDALVSTPRMTAQALVLYGAHDEVIPAEPIRRMIAAWRGPLRFAFYPGGYHILLRDREAETVWGDVLTWIDDATATLPSGRDRDSIQLLLGASS